MAMVNDQPAVETGRDQGISVILPTYNEAGTIVDVAEDVLEVLDELGGEVIVVDDDSPDGTWAVVEEEFDDELRVSVIRRQDERGLASAVLDGIRLSAFRHVVVMDADGQHPTKAINGLVLHLEAGADVAIGSRYVDGGHVEGWPWSRRLTSRVATAIARAGIPSARGVADPISGFFAVDTDVVDRDAITRADPHGYKILLELLAITPDVDVAEYPITFRTRDAGESKLTVDEQLRFLEHVGGLWLLEHGLDERVNPPLFVRSVEFGVSIGAMLALLFVGLMIGDVDDAGGAGLIAMAGAGIALSIARLWRSRDSWSESREVPAR